MSGFELISNIATAAFWPLVVLILGITLRDTLKSAVGRVTKVEAFGANLELGESVKKLDEAADLVEIEQAKRPPSPPSSGGVDTADRPIVGRDLPLRHLVDVARISPSAAIVDAWREVEASLLEYWKVVQKVHDVPDIRYSDPISILRTLQKMEMISPDQANLLSELRMTRNAVAHSRTRPSEGQSLAYVDAAALALRTLTSDKWAIDWKSRSARP